MHIIRNRALVSIWHITRQELAPLGTSHSHGFSWHIPGALSDLIRKIRIAKTPEVR